MGEMSGWGTFMETAYYKVKNSDKGTYTYYNVAYKKPGTFSSDNAICDGTINNIWTLFKTIDESYKNEIFAARDDADIIIKKEQIALYNLLADKINQVGVRQINKDSKKMTTKEELKKYLDSLK